jgi:hypothetical protein
VIDKQINEQEQNNVTRVEEIPQERKIMLSPITLKD